MLAKGWIALYVGGVAWLIDSRRRWFGLLFLLLAVIMLVWGQTWLKPHLRGLGFVVYWLVCLGWTLLALLNALTDAWATRRVLRQRQAALLREVLGTGRGKERGPEDGGRSGEQRPGQRD